MKRQSPFGDARLRPCAVHQDEVHRRGLQLRVKQVGISVDAVDLDDEVPLADGRQRVGLVPGGHKALVFHRGDFEHAARGCLHLHAEALVAFAPFDAHLDRRGEALRLAALGRIPAAQRPRGGLPLRRLRAARRSGAGGPRPHPQPAARGDRGRPARGGADGTRPAQHRLLPDLRALGLDLLLHIGPQLGSGRLTPDSRGLLEELPCCIDQVLELIVLFLQPLLLPEQTLEPVPLRARRRGDRPDV
mmetsp:Transcript_58896/g.155130  ORF Transcript_58896/g.155130 Transcript_58896/m.155130 type:complete len:246 (+) Transcript_58896:79-816(+)